MGRKMAMRALRLWGLFKFEKKKVELGGWGVG